MQNQFVKNVIKTITGSLIVKIIGFLSIAILARLYHPEQFGLFEIALSIQLVSVTFSSLKYEQAIVIPEKDSSGFNLLCLSSMILLLFSVIILVILYILRNYCSEITFIKELGIFIYFIPVMILFRGLRDNISVWFVRKKRFGREALSEVINKIFEVFLKIGLCILGVYGLFLGTIGGLAASIAVLIFYMITMDSSLIKEINKKTMNNGIIKYKQYPLYLMPSQIFRILSERIPAIILSIYFGLGVVGYYAMSFKLINEPMSILAKSIGNVYYQEGSKRIRINNDISKLVSQVMEKLFILSFLPVAFLGIGGKVLIILFLGSRWQDAGVYTQILAPMLFFRFITIPLAFTMNILNKLYVDMLLNFGLLVVSTLSLVVGSKTGNIINTLLIFSIGNSIIFIIYIFSILKYANVNIFAMINKIIMPLLISIPFIIIFFISLLFVKSNIIAMLTGVLCALLYYLIIISYLKMRGENILI